MLSQFFEKNQVVQSPFSIFNLVFQPSHTTEVVTLAMKIWAMVKFTPDQLLISSDLKCFQSSAIFFDIVISLSHFEECFLPRVEVDSHDV